MDDSGLLIGWNRVATGHEHEATELWSEMLTYLRALHAAGKIDRFEPVLLGAHGGNLNGFMLLRGSQEKLDRIRNSEEFLLLVIKANKRLEGFTVVRAHFGEEAARILRLYSTS
ncbi:MAG: hypothetical protein ACOZNI_32740 [Myxococcota bacterium]